jgi:hypothetical protein
MSVDVPDQRHDTRHFRHGTAKSQRRSLSATTRLLAAATYLDDTFANEVIDELIANEHRAVVPSFFGLDLEPIMRHALHAKRLHAYRHLALTVVLALGFALIPAATFSWLIIGACISIIAHMWSELKAVGRLVAVLIGLVVGYFALAVFVIGVAFTEASSPYASAGVTSTHTSTFRLVVEVFAYPVAVFATLVVFNWRRYTLLADGFRRGAAHQPPEVANRRVRRRIEEVSRAQHGNITTYTGWSPFLGAGPVAKTWSIAVDLVSVDDVTNVRTPVAVDPVDLHAAVLERVTSLGGMAQPDNERVTGLAIDHHVVARGERTAEHPLLDDQQRPYSFAEPDTIKAIIRHPQGGVRYYQRVTVTAEGKPIMDRFGQEITEAEDQEIGASSFMYFAVEGGMLYVEYVATVMPPIREAFHAIDALPRTIQMEWYPRILGSAARSFLPDAIVAPFKLIPALLHNYSLTRRMDRATGDAGEYLVYDYGARKSIRELGSAGRYTAYLQKLDSQKYLKFVERRMNEAVLDYLTAVGVDAAEYRERVRIVQNSGVIITGGEVSGQVVNNSPGSSISQGAPAPTQAKAAAE